MTTPARTAGNGDCLLRAVQPHLTGLKAVRTGLALASPPAELLRARTRLSAVVSVWLLRARLGFTPRQWLAQLPATINAALDWTGQTIERLSWQAARATVKAAIGAIRWRKVALVASAPFVLPAEWRGALVRIFAYLAAIYAMTLAATALFQQADNAEMLQAPPRPAWIEVDNPWPAFQLSAAGYDEDNKAYAIRRHPQGGGRKDVLSFGELGNTRRFMSVEIYRAGQEIANFASPVEEVRALGSEQGRVLGIRSGMPIGSKFGPFQTFEFGIGPFGGYNCIGFLRAFEHPRVQISGLSCSMHLLVDRSAIACALDRLTLISAGSDPEIARLFAHAEQKRHFCGQRDPLLYATPRRAVDVTSSVSSRLRLRRQR